MSNIYFNSNVVDIYVITVVKWRELFPLRLLLCWLSKCRHLLYFSSLLFIFYHKITLFNSVITAAQRGAVFSGSTLLIAAGQSRCTRIPNDLTYPIRLSSSSSYSSPITYQTICCSWWHTLLYSVINSPPRNPYSLMVSWGLLATVTCYNLNVISLVI